MAVTMIPIASPCAAAMPRSPTPPWPVGSQILIGADRTGANEDQSERTDKFGDELLRKTVHALPLNPSARILLELETESQRK